MDLSCTQQDLAQTGWCPGGRRKDTRGLGQSLVLGFKQDWLMETWNSIYIGSLVYSEGKKKPHNTTQHKTTQHRDRDAKWEIKPGPLWMVFPVLDFLEMCVGW